MVGVPTGLQVEDDLLLTAFNSRLALVSSEALLTNAWSIPVAISRPFLMNLDPCIVDSQSQPDVVELEAYTFTEGMACFSRSVPPRNASTGHGILCTTSCETLPSTKRVIPCRPLVPIRIRSEHRVVASCRIVADGVPCLATPWA
jgi:hypothetical protein